MQQGRYYTFSSYIDRNGPKSFGGGRAIISPIVNLKSNQKVMQNPFEKASVSSTGNEAMAKQEGLIFEKGDRVRFKHPGVVSSDPKLDAFDLKQVYEVDEVQQDGNNQLLHVKGFPKNEGWLEGFWWDKAEEDKE